MDKFEEKVIKLTSIPLDGGGDTHIHIYGNDANDFTITTRLPAPVKGADSIDIHTNIDLEKS